MTRLDGPLVVGARHRLGLRLDRRAAVVSVRPVALERPHSLAWQGGLPGLFTARPGFTRAARADGGTDVAHDERFAGLFAWRLAAVIRRRVRPRHEAVNVALKARVEGRGSGRGSERAAAHPERTP